MLESSVDKMRDRDAKISPDAVIVEFFDLVNSKLTVNLAILEIVLYASTVISMEEGNFGLPKPWTDVNLGVMKVSMARRSLSAAMAFENHREVLLDPLSFVEQNRMEHPMDALLMPEALLNK